MTEVGSGPVLVIDVNGVRGNSAAHALLRAGYRVRGWSHARNSETALALEQQGAEIVGGLPDTPEALRLAMTGITALVLAGSPMESGLPSESRLGERIIQVAVAMHVPYVVMLSIAGAEQHTGIPQFETKGAIEQSLHLSGLPYTILAPTFLMENLLTVNILAQLRQGRLSLPLDPDRRLQVLAAHDLGAFVLLALSRRETLVHQRIVLTSDEVTGRQMAASLTHRIGRTMEYQVRPIEQVRAWNPDYAQMFEWLNRIGFNGDVEALRNRWPEVGWRRFDTWAAEQKWADLLGVYEAA